MSVDPPKLVGVPSLKGEKASNLENENVEKEVLSSSKRGQHL
jgi:hypothetical protein